MIVIVLAVLAIVAAIVIMVWPEPTKAAPQVGGSAARARADGHQPARPAGQPDAVPATAADDPWSDHGGAAPAPSAPTARHRSAAIRCRIRSAPAVERTTAQTSFTILKHACARIVSCGNTDPLFRATCDGFTKLLPNGPAPKCAAAQRCIARLDALDCDAALDVTNPQQSS